MKTKLETIRTITITITTIGVLGVTLTACGEDGVTTEAEPLDGRISQSAMLDQAHAFVGTWGCEGQNTLPGIDPFTSEDQIEIAPAAGGSWVRWEFQQLVTPDGVPPSRGADLWGNDGLSQGLVRYRVDNGGGHGPLYTAGFAADGADYTLTWDGDVYVGSADAVLPLRHTFTIAGAADEAGYFDSFDTEVLIGGPDGSYVSLIKGHCERR